VKPGEHERLAELEREYWWHVGRRHRTLKPGALLLITVPADPWLPLIACYRVSERLLSRQASDVVCHRAARGERAVCMAAVGRGAIDRTGVALPFGASIIVAAVKSPHPSHARMV